MSTNLTPHRSIRIPLLMRIVRGSDQAAAALAEVVEPGGSLLVAHRGHRSPTGYGLAIAASSRTAGFVVNLVEIDDNDEASVAKAIEAIDRHQPDFVLGVGGGRVVDVAKLASARRSARVITIPTQLASDAICSPVATILDERGRVRSIGAQMPVAIVVDMAVVETALPRTWLAGLGDLVSNISAVRDWRLAHDRYGEAFDDFASLTSEAAALSVIEDDADLNASDYRHKIIRGLILSGIAMEMAGSSRPSSGSEHLISHALDVILDRPQPHGLQVAVATIAAGLLRGGDERSLVPFFRRVGLPVTPGDLGISIDDFIAAVRLGPTTRPGRTTCLDDIGNTEIESLRVAYERNEV